MTGLVSAMTSGLKTGSGSLVKQMSSLVSDAVNAAKNKTDSFTNVGKTFVTALANGLKQNKAHAETAGTTVGSAAVSGMRSKYDSAKQAGEWVAQGFIQGVLSKWQDAYDAGASLAEAANLGFDANFEFGSPSKVMIQKGKWVGEGFVIGMKSMGRAVYNSGTIMGETANRSITDAVSKVSEVINSSMDAQPTIRPVLDLSDVESGVGYLSSMFNGGQSLAVATNVGAISRGMNSMNQNGTNNDVVSAINKLSKNLGNVKGGDTYNVNGVTYDDGSNITEAVRTLVRAARQERRV